MPQEKAKRMKCNNPFFSCEGKSNRIAVVIRIKGIDYEICEECWNKIADSDIQWENPEGEPSLKEETPKTEQKFYDKQ